MSDLKGSEPATESPAASPNDEAPGNSFERTATEIVNPRLVVESSDEAKLREHADAIRDLRKKTIDSVCQIGRHLAVAKNIVGRGRWIPWLKEEFDWTDRTATNFIRVYDMVAKRDFENFSKLSFPISSLYLLAEPGTPDAVRNAVLKQAEAGQPVTVAGVKAQIGSARGSSSKSKPRSGQHKSAVEKNSQLTSLAWSDAKPSERTKFINSVGPDVIWNAMTPDQRSLVTVTAKLDDEDLAIEKAEESINSSLQEEDDRTGMPKFLIRDAKLPAALPEPDPRLEPSMQQAVAGVQKWLKFFTPAVQHEICNRAIAGLGEPI